MHIPRALVLLAVLALVAPAAHAQQGATFMVSAGMTAPVGDLGDFTKTGYNVQLSLAGFAPRTGGATLRVDGIFNDVGADDGGAGVDIWGINGNIVAMGGSEASGGVRPYVLGGVGYYNTKLDVDGADSRGSLGLNGGGGLMFELGSGLGAFIEVRYHHVFGAFETIGLFSSEKTPAQLIPVSFGLRF